VRFDQARATSPVTLPSHSTILTGQRPFEHGVRDNATFRLPERAVTLAERLSGAGYATGAVVGAFVLHSDFGLAQGFDVYSDVPRRKLEMDVVEDQRSATEVIDAALALLDDGDLPEPFFLWVHLFDPHRPLTPPEEYAARALDGASTQTPYAELERRMYYAEVAYADAEIGRLLDGIAQRRPALELLVAFASDHGEGFGQHKEPSHGLQLFDTTMHVPMLLHHPRLPPGRVVESAVSTADLAPTLLALLGLDADGCSGRDLSRLVADPEAALEREPIYLETCHPLYSYGWSPLFAVLDGDLKVIDGPRPAVYDVSADPDELDNLVDERPEALARARETFRRLAPATRAGERVELDDDDRRAFEQLGCTGGAHDRGPGALPPGQLDPDLADPAERISLKELCQMAVAHLGSGDQELAVSEIRRVLEYDPDNPIFLSQAGTIFITAGRLDEAERVLAHCLDQREDPSARCSLAVAQNLSGDKEAAIETLRYNVRVHPRHLHTRFALGELLLERGDKAEALEHFEAFLAEHDADDVWHETAEALAARARAE